MFKKVWEWFTKLPWYYKIPATLVVILALVLIPLSLFGGKGGARQTQKQLRALDDLRAKQVDQEIETLEQRIAAGEEETKKHEAMAEQYRKDAEKIEEELKQKDAELAAMDDGDLTVEEINAYRRKHGV